MQRQFWSGHEIFETFSEEICVSRYWVRQSWQKEWLQEGIWVRSVSSGEKQIGQD